MRNRFGKRITTLDEGDVKIIKNTNQLIKKFLNEKKTVTFGEIREHLSKNGIYYTRKGLSLRLQALRRQSIIGRRPIKQGHFSYYLTAKGQHDIALQAEVFGSYAEGLLRIHLPPFDHHHNEKYFIKRIVTRIGFFMLLSFLQSLKLTSIKKSHKENIGLMRDWLANSNPINGLANYFGTVINISLKSSMEESFIPICVSGKKMAETIRFEKILQKLYPEEYDFMINRLSELPSLTMQQLEPKKYLESIIERMKKGS